MWSILQTTIVKYFQVNLLPFLQIQLEYRLGEKMLRENGK